MLARSVLQAFGQGSFLLWALIAYRSARLILHQERRQPWPLCFGGRFAHCCPPARLSLLLDCCFLIKIQAVIPANFLRSTFADLFGQGGGLFISATILVAVLMWRSGTRPGQLTHWVWDRLLSDWREWRQAVPDRKDKTHVEPGVKKALPKVVKASQPETKALPKRNRRQRSSHQKPPVPFVKPAVKKAARPSIPVPAPSERYGKWRNLPPSGSFKKPSIDLLIAGDQHPVTAKEEDLLLSNAALGKDSG